MLYSEKILININLIKKDEDEKKKDLDAAFESFIESCGAGEEGTPELTKKLKKDTPDA